MKRRTLVAIAAAALVVSSTSAVSYASDDHPDLGLGGTVDDGHEGHTHYEDGARDPSAPLAEYDGGGVVSDGPSGKKIKNLALRGRGKRLDAGATTDVWTHEGYSYTGTFNSPCGGEEGAGVWVWNVQNPNDPSFVGVIDSPVGSRSNDVKVDTLNSGAILAHSNESCAGGPGGIELYEVSDPANPVHLSSIRADELNPISNDLFGGISDVGVHNIWLFTQGSKDYVSIMASRRSTTSAPTTSPTPPTHSSSARGARRRSSTRVSATRPRTSAGCWTRRCGCSTATATPGTVSCTTSRSTKRALSRICRTGTLG
ncbi:hypothetical protein [Haloechinothrix salitolerans]|uniref:Secreted protein n=1 Tax=Haloechinothrix salitolerans TaxID=926830 RepID=A0ABW2BTX8_9PSEU